MVEQTNRDGLQELEEKSDEARKVYERLHYKDGITESEDKLHKLSKGLTKGRFIEIGNLCLATADVSEDELEKYKKFAELGLIEASILGPKVDLGLSATAGNSRPFPTISHSIIENSTVPFFNNFIKRGSVVRDTVVEERTKGSAYLWNTVTVDAVLANVKGSSGGNRITGRIVNSNIAASGSQVIVTPR